MPAKNDRERHVGALIHRCLSTLSRELRPTNPPHGITPERLSALACIETHGPIPVTSLASMEGVRPATMSRMVTALVANGMAARRADKADGRNVLVVGTTKGKRAYRRASYEYHARLGEALSAKPELLALIQELASVVDKLEPRK